MSSQEAPGDYLSPQEAAGAIDKLSREMTEITAQARAELQKASVTYPEGTDRSIVVPALAELATNQRARFDAWRVKASHLLEKVSSDDTVNRAGLKSILAVVDAQLTLTESLFSIVAPPKQSS